MFALRRILVPTNLGEPSKAAIRYGVAFARQFGAKLFLVHVLPAERYEAVIETERVMEILLPEELAETTAEPDLEEVARNAAREDLGRLLDPEEEAETRAEYVLRSAGHSGAGDEIVACATELGVGLIVIGKHRISFVEQLISGSVTEKVVRYAPCPVLIVHHPEQGFVVPSVAGETSAP